MKLISIVDEDFNNYKKISMFIATSVCNRNCIGCHNKHLRGAQVYDIDDLLIRERYRNNPITEAIVIGGLEPFDTFDEIRHFYQCFRKVFNDPVIIYTGYEEEDIISEVKELLNIGGNLIIKYGEYKEGDKPHYDDILGTMLASDNQYAVMCNGNT